MNDTKRRGSALILVLFCFIVLSVLSRPFLYKTQYAVEFALARMRFWQYYWSAQAALEYALVQAQHQWSFFMAEQQEQKMHITGWPISDHSKGTVFFSWQPVDSAAIHAVIHLEHEQLAQPIILEAQLVQKNAETDNPIFLVTNWKRK